LHSVFEQPGAGPSSPIGILARFKVVTPEFFQPLFSRAHPVELRRWRARLRFKSTEGRLDVSITRHEFR
jgi:hypothetical protein